MALDRLFSNAFGQCPCGTSYEVHLVAVGFGENGPAALDEVPTGLCPNCDRRVYKANTLEGLETTARGRHVALRNLL
jgi:hypothetical protein